MDQGRIAGPNLENRVRQGARGWARARWGHGGGRRLIVTPPALPAGGSAAQGLRPKPVRLARIRRKSSKTKALRAPFQHLHSNTRRAYPQKRLISAISDDALRVRDPRQALPDPADLEARPRAKIAETFAASPAFHTAAQAIEADAPISGRQNIRLDEAKTPIFRAVAGLSDLQPRCNRWATTKYLIYIDMYMTVAELQDFPSRICARVCAHVRARITRGHGLQLCNRCKKRNDFNGLKVAARLRRGCGCNPFPRPSGSPDAGCHLSRRPTGRGQTQSEIQGATRRASHLRNGGPGSE